MALECPDLGAHFLLAVVAALCEQHCIYAAVVLRIVRDLRVLAPHDLPRRRHQSQVAHVHLHYRTLGDHTELRTHRTLWVLLYAEDVEVERRLEFGVGDVCLGETEASRRMYRSNFGGLRVKPWPRMSP